MRIETLLNIGDKVWGMHNDKPLEHTIEIIDITVYTFLPHTKYTARRGESAGARANFFEDEMGRRYFKTKEELIKSL